MAAGNTYNVVLKVLDAYGGWMVFKNPVEPLQVQADNLREAEFLVKRNFGYHQVGERDRTLVPVTCMEIRSITEVLM